MNLCTLDLSGWRSVHARRCKPLPSVLIVYDFTDDVHDAFACEFRYYRSACWSGRFRVPTCSSEIATIPPRMKPILRLGTDETADFADLLAEADPIDAPGIGFVFSRPLTDDESRRIERWMARRHGITLAEAS